MTNKTYSTTTPMVFWKKALERLPNDLPLLDETILRVRRLNGEYEVLLFEDAELEDD